MAAQLNQNRSPGILTLLKYIGFNLFSKKILKSIHSAAAHMAQGSEKRSVVIMKRFAPRYGSKSECFTTEKYDDSTR